MSECADVFQVCLVERRKLAENADLLGGAFEKPSFVLLPRSLASIIYGRQVVVVSIAELSLHRGAVG